MKQFQNLKEVKKKNWDEDKNMLYLRSKREYQLTNTNDNVRLASPQ